MQTICLDISNKGVIPCIQAKQSEVGRKFLAVITDGGVPYNIPSDALLSVWYEGDTDAGNYSSIEEKSAFSIDGNKVTVELVAQMLLKAGNGEMCLSISRADGGETNTWNIQYCVEYKPGAGSAVPTEYYTALTDAAARAAEQVGAAAEYANDAKSSAESAMTLASEAKSSADDAKKAAEDAAVDVSNKISTEISALADILFPIGYIFFWDPEHGSGMDLSTPQKVADHFGFGKWVQIKDVFLIAAGTSYAVGEIGGSETHTLSIEEMPSHTHQLLGVAERQASESWTCAVGSGNATETEIIVGETGGGQPFNIMPPYRPVYVWKRFK